MRFFAIFFALFTLFSTLAFAAPVLPEGEISKRDCVGAGCRFSATSNSPSNAESASAMISAMQIMLNTLQGLVGNNPSGNTPPSSTTTTGSPAPTGA